MNDREFVPPGHPRISINLHRVSGEPCVVGTRWPASIAGALRAQGYRNAEIIAMYPDITPAQIDAALAWCDDPEHKQITRNALRRQRRAERAE